MKMFFFENGWRFCTDFLCFFLVFCESCFEQTVGFSYVGLRAAIAWNFIDKVCRLHGIPFVFRMDKYLTKCDVRLHSCREVVFLKPLDSLSDRPRCKESRQTPYCFPSFIGFSLVLGVCLLSLTLACQLPIWDSRTFERSWWIFYMFWNIPCSGFIRKMQILIMLMSLITT